jgi:large subunit ribosomal protein L9
MMIRDLLLKRDKDIDTEDCFVDIILLKKVKGLGVLGDKVAVRPGYGRNYLIPGGFAVPATATNLEAFEARRAELEREAAILLESAQTMQQKLETLTITIGCRAGDEGRLFGSVGAADIVDALATQGLEIKKSDVRLPNGPLRMVGEYEVPIHLHTDVDSHIHIAIVPAE